MAFTGWPETAFDVLLQLDGDPPAEVREKWRKDRESQVRRPMIALLNELADRDSAYEDFSVWGYGKMIWFWQHQACAIRMPGKIEIGVGFDLDGLNVVAHWWNGMRDRFRAAVAGDAGAELVELLDVLRSKGFDISGDVMKRVPQGYPADHPRADLLKHRTLSAGRPLGCDDWLHTPEAADRVLDVLTELRPFVDWLSAHAGVDA
jgi:uncharacterized protein (DUF2461 family)